MSAGKGGRHAVATALTALALLLGWSGGGGPAAAQEPPSPAEEKSATDSLFEPQESSFETAHTHYYAGDRARRRGDKLAAKARETEPGKKRDRLEKRAREAYESALPELVAAIEAQPEMVPAYAALGAALRGLGDTPKALQVHAKALALAPDDEENFRGWAECLVDLNMLGDATRAYASFATTRPDRAAVLMELLKGWLAAKRADPGDLTPDAVERLADWISAQEGG